MTIRVVSIISRMNVGGPAVLIAELVRNMPGNEFEHVLVTGRCLPNEIDYLELFPLPCKVIYVNSLRRNILPGKDAILVFKLAKLIKKLNPDIVHTHMSKAGVLGRLASTLSFRKLKRIHTYHGHILYGYYGKILTSVFVKIESLLAKITDTLIAVTYEVKNDLLTRKVGKESQWIVISPGVRDLLSQNKLTSLPRNSQQPVIRLVWIGRFTKIKNPKLAISAFKELSRNNTHKFHLTMVGDGELLDECRQESLNARLDISFAGWQPSSDKFLANADLLLVTSLNEGMPLVVLEAASMGVPAVSTNVGGVKDFIKHGESGFLSGSSPDSFKNSIDLIFEDLEKYDSVRANVREKYLREFSIEIYVNKLLSLYRDHRE